MAYLIENGTSNLQGYEQFIRTWTIENDEYSMRWVIYKDMSNL